MATGPADASSDERRRMSVRLPRPLWIGLVTVALVVGAAVAEVASVLYRHQQRLAAVRLVENLDSEVRIRTDGPDWIREWSGSELLGPFDDVNEVLLGPFR